MGNWEIAKAAAWAKFGARYWRWFVFGPLAIRALGILIAVSGLMVGAWWVAQHVGGWLAWLGYVSSTYLLPMVLVAVGLIIYIIVAFIFWRLNGWKWAIKGFTSVRYTFASASLLIVCVTLVGWGLT